MLPRAIRDGALGFPRHVVLAGKVIQVKFALGIFGADIFNGRVFGLFRCLAIFGRTEAELIDLRIKIVDGRAEMQGVTQTHGNEQDVGKDQRVRCLNRGVRSGENSLFLNPCPVGLNHQVELDLAREADSERVRSPWLPLASGCGSGDSKYE